MKIHICIDLFPYTCDGYEHAHIHSRITASYDKRRKTEQGKNQVEMERWNRKSAGAKDQKKTHTQEIPNKLRVFTANRMSFKIKKGTVPESV